MGDLSANFSSSEFFCSCCHKGSVSIDVITALQLARNDYGEAMAISSGGRCRKHNMSVGGKITSEHLIEDKFGDEKESDAVDIEYKTSGQRFKLLKALMDNGFKRLGIGKTFIHAGKSKKKAQEVIWLY